jgi:hypothetical protein
VTAHRSLMSLLAIGLVTAVPISVRAKAQEPAYRYQRLEARAYGNGYREGQARGEDDARVRREFSYVRTPEYREADLGYRPEDRDLTEYRRVFRLGFEAGYTDAYDRTAREGVGVPRAGESRAPMAPRLEALSPGQQIGFRDGYEAGLKDARDREPYDPVRSDRYRDGDHHYNRHYGSRELFKQDYRVGFEQGYEQGYRVGR